MDQKVVCCAESTTQQVSCCESHGGPGVKDAAGVSATQRQFQHFLNTAAAPGALDVATKQALAIGLSVLAKCDSCLRIHIRKAKEMGFTPEEIDEAAWMAIGFGGSPTMMFYNEVKRTL